MTEQTNITKIIDYELIEDLQAFVNYGSDVQFADPSVKAEIENGFETGTLVQVEKQIASPIKIISVKEVTEQLIAENC